ATDNLSPVTAKITLNGNVLSETQNSFIETQGMLNEGDNIVTLSAIDAAGNAAADKTIHLILDTTPPAVVALQRFQQGSNPLAFTFQATVSEPVRLAGLVASSNLIPGGSMAIPVTISPDRMHLGWQFEFPAPGTYTATLTLVDLVGNMASLASTLQVQG